MIPHAETHDGPLRKRFGRGGVHGRPADRHAAEQRTATIDRTTLDRQAVDRLVVEHLPAALRFAQRLAGDADTAEDVVQETLCRVLARWRSYRGDASFKTWLMQIVVNVERDRRRRRRTNETPDTEQLESHAPDAHQRVSADELHAQIRREIDRLPERQREVACLCFGEGCSAAEVAEVLEISVANVHTCLHLARKRIAEATSVSYPKQK